MSSQILATVVGGVLKPDCILPLADQTRVRLTIEPIAGPSRTTAVEAWESIQSRLHERPLHFGGHHYARDELHERR